MCARNGDGREGEELRRRRPPVTAHNQPPPAGGRDTNPPARDIGYCPAPPRHAPHHPPPLPLGRRFSGYGVVIRRGAGNTDLPHGSRQGLFDSVCDGGGRSRALTGSRDSCGGGGLGCLLLIVMLVAVLGVLLQALGDTQADLRRGKEEGGALEDAQTQNLRGGEKGMEGASGG